MEGKILNETILKVKYSEKAKQKLTDIEKEQYRSWNDNITAYRKCSNRVYCNGNVEEKKVAITFDDAPDDYYTPRILDILKKFKVPASFSMIGLHMEENLELMKRIYKENHTLINHTYYHYDLTTLTREQLEKEIKTTEELIYHTVGVKPSIFRPPYGKLDCNVVKAISEMGYDILLWSLNTCDWVAETVEDITDSLIDTIRPGEVILLHSYENKQPTLEALEPMIVGLRKRGFEIVAVDQLLHLNKYRM